MKVHIIADNEAAGKSERRVSLIGYILFKHLMKLQCLQLSAWMS